MEKLFEEFNPVNLETWTNQIVKDLKGKDLDILDFNDPIEEIDYRAFYNEEGFSTQDLNPGAFPGTRGTKTINNEWNNGIYIHVKNESSANKEALKALMQGADMIFFHADRQVDWKIVLNEIKLEFIKIQFKVSSLEEARTILSIAGNSVQNISFCFDALEMDSHTELINDLKGQQIASFLVNGFGVQQCGATTWQEIAFCLSTGHETLQKLLEEGLTIDQAAATIHFHVGIGANYFNEIAKLRALQMLWSKVIDAYKPEHNCSLNCQITSIIGFTNKSLKDPYTNLLRQTTETMSATNGSDSIVVLPYDLHCANGASELAKRMALNISLILKEESYLNMVADPTGGSYSLERLTDSMARKAWEYFQKMESEGGISNFAEQFKSDVTTKRELRSEMIASGSSTLIGVNKYKDPEEKNTTWNNIPGYLGMETFVAELIEKTNVV